MIPFYHDIVVLYSNWGIYEYLEKDDFIKNANRYHTKDFHYATTRSL